MSGSWFSACSRDKPAVLSEVIEEDDNRENEPEGETGDPSQTEIYLWQEGNMPASASRESVANSGNLTGIFSDFTERFSDFTERRSDLTERFSDLTERRSDLTERRSDLTERRSDLTERRSDLTERRSEVTERRSDVAEKLGYIRKIKH